MPTLADFISSSDPTLVTITDNIPVVEPLDGPTTVDDVMDRFPEEVYQQGRDSHLYRFLTALGGDSGAGLVKAQAFAARLIFEAEFLNFQVLDQFYAAQFKFKRLLSETYQAYNPETDALTPTIWDAILLADQSYKQRIAEFFTATRMGNSPGGMALVAQAGSGVESEIVENYRWIADQFSDDPLGLEFEGTTNSTSEFIIVPRFIGEEDGLGYEQRFGRTYTGVAPTLANTRPTTGTGPTVTVAFDPEFQTRMDPAIERNVVDLTDRLRPVGTLPTIIPEDTRYIVVAVGTTQVSPTTVYGFGDYGVGPYGGLSSEQVKEYAIHASSERVAVNRLVTGKADVPWPEFDRTQNFFIEAGIENEAGRFYGGQELPIVFQTIEGVHAYTDAALTDPLYGTNEFYDASSGISEYDHFRSEQFGVFPPLLWALFPFLSGVTTDAAFVAQNAVAITDTPLYLRGRTT